MTAKLREQIRKIDPSATVVVGRDGLTVTLTVRSEDRDLLTKAGVVGEYVDTVGSRFSWRHIFRITESNR